DYRLAAAEYPCTPGASATSAPTAAPAYLGCFTASLMAREAIRLLTADQPRESYEIAFDLDRLHLQRFELRRCGRCRHDHAITTELLPAGATVGDLLKAIAARFGSAPMQLQARRGVGRFLSLESLRPRQGESLAALGFVPGDRVRARSGDGSAWFTMI